MIWKVEPGKLAGCQQIVPSIRVDAAQGCRADDRFEFEPQAKVYRPKFTEVSPALQTSSIKTRETGNTFIEVYKLWKTSSKFYLLTV